PLRRAHDARPAHPRAAARERRRRRARRRRRHDPVRRRGGAETPGRRRCLRPRCAHERHRRLPAGSGSCVIDVARDGGVATVTIDRQDALNALDVATLTQLRDRLLELAGDAAIRVVVITGAGEKAFVAGADIKYMSGLGPDEAKAWGALGHEATRLLETMSKPTIAAVNGFALGGGCELALACDLRYASPRAKLGQPEIDLGIVPVVATAGCVHTTTGSPSCAASSWAPGDVEGFCSTTAVSGTVRVTCCVNPFSLRFIGNACSVASVSFNVVPVASITVPVSASVNGVPALAKKSRCSAVCRYGNGDTAAPPPGCTSKCRSAWMPFASPGAPAQRSS